ncbi:MAG: hypothetical protein ACN6O6_08470 [Pseudomonas sp.]|uniref:hypothetical protein n=1 Tax=Pseudomonas sp. TaxID=306 RepID=UPI003D14C7D1
MVTHVTHYKTDGHLACGRQGDTLTSSKELNRVKCRNCRNTEVYKEARRVARNASRRAARRAKANSGSNSWRTEWQQRLTDLPGRSRLPRGFADQAYV